jgi:hypothetical protein
MDRITSTPGYFILIPIAGEQSGRDILAASGLIGSVVQADTHLNRRAVEHLIYQPIRAEVA